MLIIFELSVVKCVRFLPLHRVLPCTGLSVLDTLVSVVTLVDSVWLVVEVLRARGKHGKGHWLVARLRVWRVKSLRRHLIRRQVSVSILGRHVGHCLVRRLLVASLVEVIIWFLVLLNDEPVVVP